mmetsp:Transcript_11486/g.27720  ORF Transcript_11486/g.27720 Transcript_11486/m.27720 type:complete len:182 (+) Transcript_11486:46-591(+)|eukprot:CAMPEP_0113602552 /NCGR_PEP_ID=MMETSP0017_2-20120614/815_1 /TAXON_ID=2856 /ORGANISM="Cylindrotheca closterium" /LENGTH=181 /DNA_ID=CAMNT_0000510903 /DNA_START=46 /DNA_END=591 /DNA_ORIENTATION=- /assembly_acc=CAM_ASM_000147
MGNSHSGYGLFITSIPILVHGTECLFPMHARFVANIMPIFSFQKIEGEYLTLDDAVNMLQKAIGAAPSEKWRAAADFIFLRTFEQRQGSIGFVACAAAALYASTLPVSQRHPIHMLFMVQAALMALANLHHATELPFLGYNPFITPAGKGVGIVFVPFWAAAFYCNYMGFQDSKSALGKLN